MKTKSQNILASILIATLLLSSATLGLCRNTLNSNSNEGAFFEIGNTIVQIPDHFKFQRHFTREPRSIMYSIENSGTQWDMIFSYGGSVGNNEGFRRNSLDSYWIVDVYKGNGFLERLLLKEQQYSRKAESRGKIVTIKLIPLHDDYYKLILYAR